MELLLSLQKYIVPTLFTVIAAWAMATKQALEKNDRRIEERLSADHSNLSDEVDEVKGGLVDNRLILEGIKGDIKVLTNSLSSYKELKHYKDNELASYKGAAPILSEALDKALKIIENDKKTKV